MKTTSLVSLLLLFLISSAFSADKAPARDFWWNNPDTLIWSNLPNTLVGCNSTAGVCLNGKYYQICGINGYNQYYLYAQIFDGSSWTQSTVCHPLGVSAHSVTIWNNKIVISGGINYYGYYDYTTIYDPSVPTWYNSTPMPLPPASSTAMSVVNGKCYLFGGYASSPLASTYEWTPGDASMVTKANMPQPRYGMCAAMWNNKIYIFGGNVTLTTVGNNIWEYNPSNNSWVTKNAVLATARTEATAVTIGDRIYIIAGSNMLTSLNSVEVYNPTNDTISAGPPLLFATAGHAAGGYMTQNSNTSYTGKIYVSGGGNYLTTANLGTVTGVYCNKVQPTSLGNLKALYH